MSHKLKTLFTKVCAPESLEPSQPLSPSHDQIDIPTFPAYDPVLSEIYRHRRHIGVNLGCLFILEKWLCPPALCSWIISKPWESEHDFLVAAGSTTEARDALEEHWRTFITEADFKWMQSIGVNAVRVPIGYWVAGQEYMIGDFKKFEGVYDSAWARLLSLIDMAGKHDIGVLIDLHGAPGMGISKTATGNVNILTRWFALQVVRTETFIVEFQLTRQSYSTPVKTWIWLSKL